MNWYKHASMVKTASRLRGQWWIIDGKADKVGFSEGRPVHGRYAMELAEQEISAAPAVAFGIDQTGTGAAATLVVFHGGVFRVRLIGVIVPKPGWFCRDRGTVKISHGHEPRQPQETAVEQMDCRAAYRSEQTLFGGQGDLARAAGACGRVGRLGGGAFQNHHPHCLA